MIIKTFFAALLLIFSFGAYAQSTKQGQGDMPAEILRLVNGYRAGKGLPALKMNGAVAREAEKHSSNMASKKVPFGHDGFDQRTARIAKELKHTSAFAENVAYGAKTAKEAMDMWLHSAGHRANIEGDYKLTGIGIAKGADGNLYFTQIFVN